MKKPAIFALIGVVVLGVIVGAYFLFFSKNKRDGGTETSNKRQLINALPISERPFVAIFPHPTNKLITLMVDKKPDSDLTIDIEYLSGNALKGGRTTIL